MRVALLALLAACGRIGFAEQQRTGDAAGDATRDAPADARPDVPPGVIGYVGAFAQQHPGPGSTDSFTTTATAGDFIVLQVSCGTTSTAPTGVSVSATAGWSFAVTSASAFNVGLTSFAYAATAPVTGPVTVNVTWAGTTCDIGLAEIGDEFEHVFSVDNSLTAGGTGDCVSTMTAHFANEAVWAACFADTSLLGIGAGFTKGADDMGGDWTEYKLTSDPISTQETATFHNSNSSYMMTGMTLEPM